MPGQLIRFAVQCTSPDFFNLRFFLLKLSRNFSYQSTTQDEMTETIFRYSREEKSLFESFGNVDITVCEPVREVRTVSSLAEKGSSFKTPGLLTKSFERQRALSHPMHKLHKCALVVAFDNWSSWEGTNSSTLSLYSDESDNPSEKFMIYK